MRRKIVWTGSADFVDASEAVIGDVKMEVSVSDFFGRRR